MKVLAVDQVAGERQERPTVAKAVTVELTSEQSLKVLLATNIGKLSLILRQAREDGSGPATRVTERDLMPGENNRAASTCRSSASGRGTRGSSGGAAQTTSNVTVVRGTKREEYAVIRGDR